MLRLNLVVGADVATAAVPNVSMTAVLQKV
jgi:hypothetical protein